MDNDLISRSALKKTLCEEYEAREHYIGEIMLKAIDNAPTVEPDCLHCKQYQGGYDYGFNIGYNKGKKERPQGEWLHPYTTNIACECSNCHMQMPITDYYNFCPNCGAWMEGGAE